MGDLKSKGLEVVFVSSDKDEAQFTDYFKEMPWLALDFADRQRKTQLSGMFGVRGIPALVIIDKDGSVITTNGRGAVSSDPQGAKFPWYPPAVSNAKDGPGDINDVPTVVALCETSTAEEQAAIEEAMTRVAKQYIEKQKAADEESPEFNFIIATENEGIAPQLRQLMSLPEVKSNEKEDILPAILPAKLMLVDIPSDGAFYDGPSGEISVTILEKFLSDYKAGALERKQLS